MNLARYAHWYSTGRNSTGENNHFLIRITTYYTTQKSIPGVIVWFNIFRCNTKDMAHGRINLKIMKVKLSVLLKR